MTRQWQLQEAKQRFSELIRAVGSDGPQVVTKHGRATAVVLDIEEYRRLKGGDDFKSLLMAGPLLDDLEVRRDPSGPREVELA